MTSVEIEGMIGEHPDTHSPEKHGRPPRAYGFELVTLDGVRVRHEWGPRAGHVPISWSYPDNDPSKRPITVRFGGQGAVATYETLEVRWL